MGRRSSKSINRSKNKMKLILHHILIWVSDMTRAVEFYTDILGLPLKFKSENFSVVGGEKFWMSLHFSLEAAEERLKANGPIVLFKPEDVDTAYEELKNKGVNFYRTPYWAAPNVRVAEFYDPEGNKLALSSAD